MSYPFYNIQIERFLSQPGVFGEEGDEPRPAPSPYQVPHMVGSLSYEIEGEPKVAGPLVHF